MSGSSAAPPQRPALKLQIKLPCASLDEVRARYGERLRQGLFFVRTAQPRAVGTVARLEAQLRDGSACFRAAATVARAAESPAPEPGMELRLFAVDEAGRALLAEVGGPKLKVLRLEAFTSPSSPGVSALESAAAPGPSAPDEASATPAAAAPEARAAPARAGPVIGIDLGTSNVCVAVVREGKPRVIGSREGHQTIPAVVALGEDGKLLVGHPARRQLLLHPQSTVHGAKRLLGRAFDSPAVREVASRVPYLIVAGERGEAAVQLGARRLSMQEISALVLGEAKALAERDCGAEVTRAVITVPARYSERQRQAVREAARLAGLHVERLLTEPTAAALAFAHGRSLEKRILVYDLGGGTFDASLVELRGNVYEVLATGGDSFLGGVDFDRALVGHLLQAFREQHGLDFPGERAALQRLHEAAERAKIALSEQLEVRVREPFIAERDGQPLELDVTLSRSELVLLAGHLVDKTLAVCREVVAARGFASKDLHEVLLVGGQSRMPLVRERIRNLFGLEPSKAVHPDEAVALGAALLAHELEAGAIDGAVLIDVLPLSLRLATPGGGSEELVARNTALPHQRAFAPRVATGGQTSLALALFQGDSAELEEDEYLGTLTVSGLPPMERGSRPVELTLSLDAESRLTATAREQESDRPLEVALAQSEGAEEALRRAFAETPFERAPEKIVVVPTAELDRALAAIPSAEPEAAQIVASENKSGNKFQGAAAAAPRQPWLRKIFGKKK